jgi:hypothetical protein
MPSVKKSSAIVKYLILHARFQNAPSLSTKAVDKLVEKVTQRASKHGYG